MVKQSVTDFKNWLASLREYKKHPEKYLGKPKMPRYKKSDLTTVIITNQDAVLYRDVLKTAFDVYGFHKLNPKGIPVKGIAA